MIKREDYSHIRKKLLKTFNNTEGNERENKLSTI